MGIGTAIAGGALIGGISSIFAGKQQSKAAQSQADAATRAALINQQTALSAQNLQAQQFQAALDEQRRQYYDAQKALAPYQQVGKNALYRLQGTVYGNAPSGTNTAYAQPQFIYDSQGRVTGTTENRGGTQILPSGASYNWDTGQYTPSSATPGMQYDPYGPPSPGQPATGNYSYGASTALPQAPNINYTPSWTAYGVSTTLPSLPTKDVSAYPSFGSPGSVAPGTYDASAIPDFQQSPGYQFQLSEGQKAIDRSLAARGLGLSGASVKEGIRYATGLANQDYNNYFNQKQQELARRQSVYNDYQQQKLANIAQQAGLTQDEFNRALALSNTAYSRGQQDFSTEQAAANNNFLRQLELSNTAYGRQQGEQQNAYNQYQDYLNRVASLAGVGQTATTQGINLGQNYASNLGNLYTTQGNVVSNLLGQQGQAAANAAIAQGQGAAGTAQAWGNVAQGLNNAAQGGIQNYLLLNYLNKNQSPAQIDYQNIP
jgi:hypothetical protein